MDEVKVGQKRQFRESGSVFEIKVKREGRSQYYYDCWSETNQREESHSEEVIECFSDVIEE